MPFAASPTTSMSGSEPSRARKPARTELLVVDNDDGDWHGAIIAAVFSVNVKVGVVFEDSERHV